MRMFVENKMIPAILIILCLLFTGIALAEEPSKAPEIESTELVLQESFYATALSGAECKHYNFTYGLDDENHWSKCIECGAIVDESTIVPHDYVYSRNSSQEHWMECVCGATSRHGSHYTSCVNDDRTRCDVCNVMREFEITHNFKQASDADTHYLVCTDCSEKRNIEPHYIICGNGSGTQCAACGAEWSQVTHTLGGECEFDAEGHWGVCAGCGESIGREAHYSACTGAEDGKCDACGAEWSQVAHDYQPVYNNSQHWEECADCGDVQNKEGHILSCEDYSTCVACGQSGIRYTSVGHEYGDLTFDSYGHFRRCEKCWQKMDEESHYWNCSDEEGVCSVCGLDGDAYSLSEDHIPVVHGDISYAYSSDETGHWYDCPDCSMKVEFREHSAYCSEPGICSECGYEHEEMTVRHSFDQGVCMNCSEACTHENAELMSYINLRVEGFEQYDDKYHWAIGTPKNEGFCWDCYQDIQTPEYPVCRVLWEHDFDIDTGVCADCEYDRGGACDHSNTIVETGLTDQRIMEVTDTHHTISGRIVKDIECADCGEWLDIEYTDEVDTFTQPHEYAQFATQRDCASCGYTTACKHENVVKTYDAMENATSYELAFYSRGSEGHEVYGSLCYNVVCQDCKGVANQYETVRGKVYAHDFEDGMCVSCGYVDTPDQEEDPEDSELTLPGDLVTIEAEAFAGSTTITKVVLPQSVTSIGSKAFADCTKLTRVVIPAINISIAEDAFNGCTNITFVCPADSDAVEYAEDKGFKVVSE